MKKILTNALGFLISMAIVLGCIKATQLLFKPPVATYTVGDNMQIHLKGVVLNCTVENDG